MLEQAQNKTTAQLDGLHETEILLNLHGGASFDNPRILEMMVSKIGPSYAYNPTDEKKKADFISSYKSILKRADYLDPQLVGCDAEDIYTALKNNPDFNCFEVMGWINGSAHMSTSIIIKSTTRGDIYGGF